MLVLVLAFRSWPLRLSPHQWEDFGDKGTSVYVTGQM